jgi:hypothetical protein
MPFLLDRVTQLIVAEISALLALPVHRRLGESAGLIGRDDGLTGMR